MERAKACPGAMLWMSGNYAQDLIANSRSNSLQSVFSERSAGPMEKSFNVLARQLAELIDQLKETTDREKRKEILIWMRLVMAEVDDILGLKNPPT
jgi:hypothetical protein